MVNLSRMMLLFILTLPARSSSPFFPSSSRLIIVPISPYIIYLSIWPRKRGYPPPFLFYFFFITMICALQSQSAITCLNWSRQSRLHPLPSFLFLLLPCLLPHFLYLSSFYYHYHSYSPVSHNALVLAYSFTFYHFITILLFVIHRLNR